MKWFDQSDARLMAKTAVVMVTASTIVLTTAATLGAAWRVFHLMAGG
jgi:hypothetical protein